MRLWSLHPRYLDRQGLTALWREALLARAVLRGDTIGYRRHPQLERFKAHSAPGYAISFYLSHVFSEASTRGYKFDAGKIGALRRVELIPVTSGQMSYEWDHLLRKLSKRSQCLHQKWLEVKDPDPHPLFILRPGGVESWERTGETGQ